MSSPIGCSPFSWYFLSNSTHQGISVTHSPQSTAQKSSKTTFPRYWERAMLLPARSVTLKSGACFLAWMGTSPSAAWGCEVCELTPPLDCAGDWIVELIAISATTMNVTRGNEFRCAEATNFRRFVGYITVHTPNGHVNPRPQNNSTCYSNADSGRSCTTLMASLQEKIERSSE